MKSRAAILFETGQKLEVREVDVDDPKPGEIRIKMAAAGVCHTDLHVMTGDVRTPLPAILGHVSSAWLHTVTTTSNSSPARSFTILDR